MIWGRRVNSIHLSCDCSLKLQNFPGAVTQRIGEPLNAESVSESLKRLYGTGRFSELRAEGAVEGDGVSLTFVARAQYFIGIVNAIGNPGAIEARAFLTASRLRMGHPLTEEELVAARQTAERFDGFEWLPSLPNRTPNSSQPRHAGGRRGLCD